MQAIPAIVEIRIAPLSALSMFVLLLQFSVVLTGQQFYYVLDHWTLIASVDDRNHCHRRRVLRDRDNIWAELQPGILIQQRNPHAHLYTKQQKLQRTGFTYNFRGKSFCCTTVYQPLIAAGRLLP